MSESCRLPGRVLLAVLFAAVLAGCAGQQQPPPSPKPSAGHPVSAKPAPAQPSIADIEVACKGGVPFYSPSPPYAGAGPHRLIGFQLADANQQKQVVPSDPPNLLPNSWAADQGSDPEVFPVLPEVSDYRNAQLAVCMSPPMLTGAAAGTCSYGMFAGSGIGTPVDVVAAYYGFTVFEASTGRLVESFRIDGSPGNCPSQYSSGDTRKIAEGIDDDALAARLRPLVEGTAPA